MASKSKQLNNSTNFNISKYYSDKDGLKLLSFNAIYYFIFSNRNYGKTWLFLKRAFRRGIKKGKRTLWLRLFKDEIKIAKDELYKKDDLLKFCGASIYDKKDNPNGNLKQEGCKYFCKHNGKWINFLLLAKLGDRKAIRGFDNPKLDTIVFDEFSHPKNEYNLYRGNMVDDINDILFSVKRNHITKAFFLGNRETIENPFFDYFHINLNVMNFEGFNRFRANSIVVQYINNKQNKTIDKNENASKDYDLKLKALFKGTKYGDFLNSQFKDVKDFKKANIPVKANLYIQLIINSNKVRICELNGLFYCDNKIDKSKLIYTNELSQRLPRERTIFKNDKKYLIRLIDALAFNRIYFNDIKTYLSFNNIIKWFNIN